MSNLVAYDDFRSYTENARVRSAAADVLNSGRGWSGPFSIAEYESVASRFIHVTVSDSTVVGLQASHSELLRSFDFSWSSIRIGLHFSFAFSGSIIDPGLTLGVVNFAGAGFGQPTTANFIGAATADPTDVGRMAVDNQDVVNPQLVIRPMVRSTSGIAPAAVAITKVGTSCQSAPMDAIPRYAIKPASSLQHRRSFLLVDITKGSPNYGVKLYTSTASLAARDTMAEDFLTAMLVDVPRIQSENLPSAKASIAASESAGVLNAINCFWPSTVPIVFHAVSARKLS